MLNLHLDAGDDAFYEGLIADRAGIDTTNPWLDDAVRWGWRTKLYVSFGTGCADAVEGEGQRRARLEVVC